MPFQYIKKDSLTLRADKKGVNYDYENKDAA